MVRILLRQANGIENPCQYPDSSMLRILRKLNARKLAIWGENSGTRILTIRRVEDIIDKEYRPYWPR
jgi:hypothetical protein